MQRISGYSRRHVASLIFTEHSCLESYMPLLASISSQGVELLGIRHPRFRLSTPHTLPKTSLYCEELLRSLSQYPSSCGRWHDSWVLPIAVQVPWATCRFTYFHREETTFCTLIGGSGLGEMSKIAMIIQGTTIYDSSFQTPCCFSNTILMCVLISEPLSCSISKCYKLIQ